MWNVLQCWLLFFLFFFFYWASAVDRERWTKIMATKFLFKTIRTMSRCTFPLFIFFFFFFPLLSHHQNSMTLVIIGSVVHLSLLLGVFESEPVCSSVYDWLSCEFPANVKCTVLLTSTICIKKRKQGFMVSEWPGTAIWNTSNLAIWIFSIQLQ